MKIGNLRFQNTSCYIFYFKKQTILLPFLKMFIFILHVNKSPHLQIVLSYTRLNYNRRSYLSITKRIALMNNNITI